MTGHVNNVTYNRWAESARVNWGCNFAALDGEHRDEWKGLVTPTGIGMILRSIRTDYKLYVMQREALHSTMTSSDTTAF